MFFWNLFLSLGQVFLFLGFLPVGRFVYDWIYDTQFGISIGKGVFGRFPKLTYRIYPPLENPRSMAEMDAFFRSLSANFTQKTAKDIFVEGKWHDEFTFEIHSNGGVVQYYLTCKDYLKNNVETTLLQHYPGTVIRQCRDPFADWPDEWVKGKHPLFGNMFGGDINHVSHDINPTQIWQDFQNGSDAPDYDPVTQLISMLETIPAKNYAVIQFVLRPWPVWADLQKPWQAEFDKIRTELATNASVQLDESTGRAVAFTDQEKSVLNGALRKMNGETYKMKFRFVYMMGEKEGRGLIQGKLFTFLKQFAGPNQGYRPDKDSKSSTDWGGEDHPFGWIIGAKFAEWQEKNYWQREQYYREKRAYMGMLKRHLMTGSTPFVIDTEELAALFHFPITSTPYGLPALDVSRLSTDYGVNDNAALIGLPPSNLPM